MLPKRHPQPLDSLPKQVGSIVAGPEDGELNLSEFLLTSKRFVLRMQGDSMREAGILAGDMLVVERGQRARAGDIVVALIDQEVATVKIFSGNIEGMITLRAANSAMPPFRFPAARVQLQGVVVGQMRSYR